jgi:hypothetical protein
LLQRLHHKLRLRGQHPLAQRVGHRLLHQLRRGWLLRLLLHHDRLPWELRLLQRLQLEGSHRRPSLQHYLCWLLLLLDSKQGDQLHVRVVVRHVECGGGWL